MFEYIGEMAKEPSLDVDKKRVYGISRPVCSSGKEQALPVRNLITVKAWRHRLKTADTLRFGSNKMTRRL